MGRQLEKRLFERAVAIGREGEVAAFSELPEMRRSSSANARRLAASAPGKLAWLGVDQAAAVAALAPAARHDPHAQTRQFGNHARHERGGRSPGWDDSFDRTADPVEDQWPYHPHGLPPCATAWFLNVFDDRNCAASTPHEEREQP